MKRKSLVVILSILLVFAVIMAVSLGAMSLASDGHEKIDSGDATTHTKGLVTVIISEDSNGKTYVSYVAINVPEGCVVTKIVIVVKGGDGSLTYTVYDVSSASGMFYSPVNNGGQRADVSHVDVYYWYYCPTPTPPVGTPTPTIPVGTPTPSDPGNTPTPPGDTPTPTPNNSTPTPFVTEPPVRGRG